MHGFSPDDKDFHKHYFEAYRAFSYLLIRQQKGGEFEDCFMLDLVYLSINFTQSKVCLLLYELFNKKTA